MTADDERHGAWLLQNQKISSKTIKKKVTYQVLVTPC